MRDHLKTILVWFFILILINNISIINSEKTRARNTQTYPKNPFETYYSEPDYITDIVIDPETNTAFIGSTYGLIIKELNKDKTKVISYYNGLDNNYIVALELDKEHSRLFIIVQDSNDIFIMDINSLEIINRIHLSSSVSLLHYAEFDTICYETSNNLLFIGEDTGLVVVDLEDESFKFYDIFYFDVNFSKYEIDGNRLHAEMDEYFSINGFDFNQKTNELYIATSVGLTIYDIDSGKFRNFRKDSELSSEFNDVLFISDFNKLYLGGKNLIQFDLNSELTIQYPSITWDYANDNPNKTFFVNQSIYSLTYDPNNQIIFALLNPAIGKNQFGKNLNVGWYGIAIFDPFKPKIIRKFIKGDDKEDGNPIFASFSALYFNDVDNKIYLSTGWQKKSKSKWIIDYEKQSDSKNYKTNNNEITEKRKYSNLKVNRDSKSLGTYASFFKGVLYTFDYKTEVFNSVNLSNSPTEKYYEDYYRVITEEHKQSGDIIFGSTDSTLIFDSDMTISKIFNDSWLLYDVEFYNGEFAFLATSKGLFQVNMTSTEYWEIDDENISGTVGFDKGRISDNLYLSTENGVAIYDPIKKESWSYPFPNNLTYKFNNKIVNRSDLRPQIRGIGVSEIHHHIYLTLDRPDLILKLDTLNGKYTVMENSSGAAKRFSNENTGFGLHYGMVEVYHETGEIFINTNMGLIDEHVEYIHGFPETGSINSFFIDQEGHKLFAITGEFDSIGGGCHMWTSETVKGLIIFDLINRTYVNYSMDQGLPSNILSGVMVKPKENIIHLTGKNFYSIVKDEELSNNVRRDNISMDEFIQKGPDQVLGFPEEKDPNSYLFSYISIGVVGFCFIIIISFYIATEPFKYKLIASFVTPFYTRIRKDRVLQHNTRGRIQGYVQSEPGVHYNELKKNLELNNGALSYHLRVLEREGYVRSMNKGRYKHFFPGNLALPKKIFRMNEIQKLIFKKLMENPGLSQKEIATEIGSLTTTVNYNIKIMIDKGIVELKRVGKETKCYLILENGEMKGIQKSSKKDQN